MTSPAVTKFSRDFWNGFIDDHDTDMQVSSNDLLMGNQYVQTMVLQHESCFQDELKTSRPHAEFTADDFSFYQGFTKKWQGQLEKQIESLKKSANFGSQNLITCEKLQQVLDQIVRDEQSRLVRGQFNVMYWHIEKEQLKEITGKLMAECKQLDAFGCIPATISQMLLV